MSFSCFGSFFITNCSSSIRKNKRNQKSGDSITFNNCKGLLEADPNAIISGSVKVKAGSNQNSNSYNYDKFTVLDGDGDKTTVGTPTVKGTKVTAKVLENEVKGEKLRVIRYKSKKRVHKEIGHRQKYSRIEITSIK